MAVTAKTEAKPGEINTAAIESLINETPHSYTFSYDTVGIASPGTTGITTDVLKVSKSDKVGVKLYVDQANVIFKPYNPSGANSLLKMLFSGATNRESKEMAIAICRLIKARYGGKIMDGKW